ncbi:MAG: extracellular solute-binding protein [Oscillospiraceae bacterium]
MKKVKSLLALLLAFAMLLALLAGCSGGGDDKDAAEDTPTQQPATVSTPSPDEKEDEPTEPPSMYPLVAEGEEKEFTVFMAIAGFIPLVIDFDGEGMYKMRGLQAMEKATGVHLEFTCIDQDAYFEQLNILFATQEYTDFIGAPDTIYPGGIDALIEDDVCIDIAPYLETCLPDFYSKMYTNPQYEEYAKLITSDTGKISTIYTYEDQSTMGSQIRKDWLDQLNLEIPDTYDDMYNVLKAFKTELNVKYPMIMTYQWGYSNNNFVGGFDTASAMNGQSDIGYHVENGKVVASVTSQNYKDYITMLNKWYSEGLIGDVSTNVLNEMMIQEYVARNEVGYWAGQSDFMGEGMKAQAGDTFDAQPMEELTRKPGDTFKLFANNGGKSPSGGWAVSTACDDPEMALKVINWFWTDEGYVACNFGVEGETFNYVDGKVAFTDLVLRNENGFNALFNACGEILFFDIPFFLSMDRKLATLSNQAEIDSQTVWRQNRSNEMRYYGTLTVEETERYNELVTDIATFVSENISKFVVGDRPMSEWDSFIDQLYEMHIQELVDIRQASYERFLKR